MNPGGGVVVTTDEHINDDGFTTLICWQKKNKAATIKGQPVNISSNQVRELSSQVKRQNGEVRHSKRAKAHYI